MWAFEGCEKLTSIVIPNSVTSIGYFAFQYCANLKKIIVPQGYKDKKYFSYFKDIKKYQATIIEIQEDEINILLRYAQIAELENEKGKAIVYYIDAEKLGSEEAAYKLATFYLTGNGATKDLFKAHYYMLKAAKAGYKDAQQKLQEIEMMM